MKFGADGRLYAINPEYGMFGVAPGTGLDTNPNAIAALDAQHRVHQRRAHRRRRRVVGRADRRARPRTCTDWMGNDWTPGVGHAGRAPEQPLHRAARRRCRRVAPEWEDPDGVPISAILFGGRRAQHGAARHRGVQLAARRVPRLDHGLGDDGRRGRRGRQPAPRPVRDAAVLRLPHGRLLRALAARSASTADDDEAAEALLRQLVPQGRRRQVPLARLRREQPRARVGVRPVRGRRRPRRDTAIGRLPDRRRAADRRARRSRRARSTSCSRSTTDDVARRAAARSRSTTRCSATGCRTALRDELDALAKRLADR